MNTFKRILVVLDGSSADEIIVAKAVRLARRDHAELELFMCDAERAYSLSRAYDQATVTDFREHCLFDLQHYLGAIKAALAGTDSSISVAAACESPLYAAIVRRACESGADLVIKSRAGARDTASSGFDANDWQLMRACPATLWLSRGLCWSGAPRLGAAVDVSKGELAELPQAILNVMQTLSVGYDAHVELLYSEPCNVSAAEHRLNLARLSELAESHGMGMDAVRMLSGDAEQTLPAFSADRGYDAWIMGALTHHEGLTALVGTLTSKLVEALQCDFVLVKPPVAAATAHNVATPRSRHDAEALALI